MAQNFMGVIIFLITINANSKSYNLKSLIKGTKLKKCKYLKHNLHMDTERKQNHEKCKIN